MTGDENDRRCISGQQLLLEFETTGTRKLQVQDQACGSVWLFRFQEFGSGVKHSHSKASRGDKAVQRFPYTVIIIHHEDNGAIGVHDAAGRPATRTAATGIVNEKVVPAPSTDAAHSRP